MVAEKYNTVLTIAGFDGSGGAGMQADLKTYAALGCYGLSVLTALPAQNTQGVRQVYELSPACVQDQLAVLFEDIEVRVAKVGMLHRREIIEAVVDGLKRQSMTHIVVDPVIYAKSGDRLLDEAAIDSLKNHILPLATVLTPNIPEAEALLGAKIKTRSTMVTAAAQLQRKYGGAVVIKGGHWGGKSSPDCLCHGEGAHWLEGGRIITNNTHGTGCTFSAAIAAGLARGVPVLSAVRQAKDYLCDALQAGARFRLGQGHGPVHHFQAYWS